MLKLSRVSDVYDMRVFTEDGDYFGDIEEAILTKTKVYGWRVKSTKNSYLAQVLGTAKGVIVPHQLVKAMGDVMVISRTALPNAPVEE